MSLSADEVTSPPLHSEPLNPSEHDTCGQDTESSSTAIHQHLQKPVFGCGCKHCTIANFMDGCRSPVTTKTGLPYLDASGLTEVQKDILVGRLLDESEDYVVCFSAPFIEGNKVTETTKHPTRGFGDGIIVS